MNDNIKELRPHLSLREIVKSFGPFEVLHGIDLDIGKGEFVVLVGPSGCGKSTLLRLISGLEEISGGELFLDGKRINDTTPSQRGMAMVFQSYALYPHMTVAQNMGFALRMAKAPKAEIDVRVNEVAQILQLEPLLERKPKQLSGGQRQRVAIGRALVRDPSVFLFDEPLSNLDAELRVQMRVEIARLHQKLKTTMIYVTHDQVEAMTLADRIVVMQNGYVEQVGTPLELYHQPANVFVAQFIGSPKMNLMESRVVEASSRETVVGLPSGQQITLPVTRDDIRAGAPVKIGIRPEDIAVGANGGGRIDLKVDVAECLGGTTYLYGENESGERMVVEADGGDRTAPNTMVPLSVDPALCHLFSEDGQSFFRLESALSR